MPKIIGKSLAEHREHVRTRLFVALAELMEERGFDSVSFADIAARAKVGRTSVYNHFPDKESLLIGFIEHETASFVQDLQRAISEASDPEEQLCIYVRQQILLKRTYHLAPGPDLRSVVSRSTLQRLREHVEEVELLLRAILMSGIRSGHFPSQDLDAVVPLVHSCLTGRPVPSTDPERERFITATEIFILRAVGGGSQAAVA